MHLAGGWVVLDQLDELVAEHHLAAGRRDGLADDETLIVARLLTSGHHVHPVAVPILPAEYEIFAAALEGLLQRFGMGDRKVGGREHVEPLPYRELDDRLVLRRHAPHACRRVVPPLLFKQKRLNKQVERRSFPLRIGKPPILRLRLDQGPGSLIGREVVKRGFEKLSPASQGVLGNLHLPLRRRRQMRGPVDIGERQGNWRYATGQARQPRVERTIGFIGLLLLVPASKGCQLGTRPVWRRTEAFAAARGMSATRQSRHSSPR